MNKILIKFLIFFFFFTIFQNIYAEEKKFEGYQVKFDYENYPEEREISYRYILKDTSRYTTVEEEYDRIYKDHLGIDFYDIDDDGEKEILIYLQHPSYCGSHGCSFYILKKSTEYDKDNILKYNFIEWSKDGRAGYGLTVSPQIKFLNSKTNKIHDVVFGKFLDPVIWKWQDTNYEYQDAYDNIRESLKN